jgi:hypothetical protein
LAITDWDLTSELRRKRGVEEAAAGGGLEQRAVRMGKERGSGSEMGIGEP